MTLLLVLLGLYLGVILLVAWVSLRPPRTPIFASPGAFGAAQETVEIAGETGTLRGWWLPRDDARATVVLVHGYCMNRAEWAAEGFLLWREGYRCLLVDLRGHGRSHGARCGFGWRERRDIAAAVAYARSRGAGPVVLMGSSMGAAACAFAMGDDPELADALILDSVYGRLASAILGWWRFLGGRALMIALWPTAVVAIPLAGLNPFTIRVPDAMRRVTVPTLILHGRRDTLALPPEAEAVHAACAGPAELVWFDGCNHAEGRWERPEEYRRALLGFLESSVASLSDR